MTFAVAHGFVLLGTLGAFLCIASQFLKKKPKTETLFLLLMLTLGISYIFVITPLSPPDDITHYKATLTYAARLTGNGSMTDAAYVDMTGLTPHVNSAGALEAYYTGLVQEKTSGNMVWLSPVEISYPVAYIPQIIGASLAMLLHANRMVLYLLVSLCNWLFYTICVYMAIRRIPQGKTALMLCAVLPMSLQQCGSCSPDAFANGMTWLLFALLYPMLLGKPADRKQLTAFTVTALLLTPFKAVYFLLMLAMPFIPDTVFGTRRKKYVWCLTLIGVCALWTLAVQLGVLRTTPEIPRDIEYYSISYALSHPVEIAKVFYRSFLPNRLLWMTETMLGSELSGLTLRPDGGLVWVMFMSIMTIAITAPEKDPAPVLEHWTRMWLLLLCFGVLMATHVVMLTQWTPVGALTIEGFQGRYLLPVFPVVLAALYTGGIKMRKSPRTICYVLYFTTQAFFLLKIVRMTLNA